MADNYLLLSNKREAATLKRKIILIIDRPKKIDFADLTRHDLEGYNPLEAKLTKKALSCFAPTVLYTNPSTFMKLIWLHKNDIIFPMAWGKGRRNDKAILPALCEGWNIPYVGADAYTHMLFNDKFMAKQYGKVFGFQSPKSILIYENQNMDTINSSLSLLKFPIIVKPNFCGGSCGISEKNLVGDKKAADNIIDNLFKSGYSVLIAEEYVEGYEISILLCGYPGNVTFCGQVELEIDHETYFKNRIWGYETKKIEFERAHYRCSQKVPYEELERAKRLFCSLSKAEFLRIDGRLNERGFYMIELTADCYLGPKSDFCIAFEDIGLNHSQLLQHIVQNALTFHSRRDTPKA